MKMSRVSIVATVVLAFSLMACSQSPLLNHANAAQPSAAKTLMAQKPAQGGPGSSTDCPLSFQKAQLCAALTWTKQPTETETGSFELDFWDPAHGTKQGPYVDPSETLFVKLWMPDMGHGS